MIKKLLICLFLLIVSPVFTISAEMHTMEIEFSFSIPADSTKQLSAYRLYQEGTQVCQTNSPSETSEPGVYKITCDFITEEGTFDFTLTALYSDDSESPSSPAFPFTIVSTPEPLLASIAPTTTTGTVPLNISFDGTGSTGDISSYSWNFGDGTNNAGATANHIYSVAGTYTAVLQVEDQSGATQQASITITALPIISPLQPPNADISSSTSAGHVPHTVTFDGTKSTTPNGSILSYNWTFGDGSQPATGQTTSHTFTTAGTYSTQLTVVDDENMTDTFSVSIIVTDPPPENEKPISVITAELNSVTDPFTFTFDATQSSDPDGTITQYSWNFGDGTTGSGSIVQHTYTSEATYTVSLLVEDNSGDTATTSTEIVCDATIPISIEVGEVSINHDWLKVSFENSFKHPVVIAGPPTENGGQAALVRVRNITETGFEVRIQEWDYLDGKHFFETFSYIVIEQGIYTLSNGTRLEAGYFSGTSSFNQFYLKQMYDDAPVVLTQVVSENETDAVTGRVRNVSQNSFEFKLQEMELTLKNHVPETIGYIAWEPGSGEVSGLLYEIGVTSKYVNHKWYNLDFETAYPSLPFFIAGMQTCDGGDPATIRYKNLSEAAIEIHLGEEQSKDSEIYHYTENVGYFTIGVATQ